MVRARTIVIHAYQEHCTVKRYRCVVCDHIYDPAIGDPDSRIPPGTAFEDLPSDWCCPECGASKQDFAEMAD